MTSHPGLVGASAAPGTVRGMLFGRVVCAPDRPESSNLNEGQPGARTTSCVSPAPRAEGKVATGS